MEDECEKEPVVHLSRSERDRCISEMLSWLHKTEKSLEGPPGGDKRGSQVSLEVRNSAGYKAMFQGVFDLLSQKMKEDVKGAGKEDEK